MSFADRIPPFHGGFQPLLHRPEVFSKTLVDWTPSGVVFRQTKSADALAEKAWAKLPRRGIFISADGLLGRNRQKQIEPSDGTQRKKAEVVPFRTASALTYFQSLKRSSIAKSRAVFKLLCMNERISASSTDFFFSFFLFLRSLISASPRL